MLPFMMGEGSKKIASIIVEKKEPSVEEMTDNETDYGPGKEAAVGDILSAIENKDAKLLKSALEDLIAMCMDEYELSEPKEEEEVEESPESEIADKLRKKLGWK